MTKTKDLTVNPQDLLSALAALDDAEQRQGLLETFTPGQLAKVFLQLRDDKATIETKAKELTAPYTETMDLITARFLADMNQTGETNKSGDGWRATRKQDVNCRMPDPEAFFKFLEETKRFDMLQKRLTKSAVQDYQKETGKIPPGVSIDPYVTVVFYNKA